MRSTIGTASFRRQSKGFFATLCLLTLVSLTAPIAGAEPFEPRAAIRSPAALVALPGRVVVANRRSNSLSVIDGESNRVIAEHQFGAKLVSIARRPGSPNLFALDGDRHSLCLVSLEGKNLATRKITAVAKHPSHLIVAEAPPRVIVSSKWSRQVTIVHFDDKFARAIRTTHVSLNFSPGELLALPPSETTVSVPSVVVASAFGGRLAIIETDKGVVRTTRKLPLHNIRGLALSSDKSEVVLTHQSVDAKLWGDRDAVHWGLLMANSLRGVKISRLLDESLDPMKESWLDAQGLVGNGAGDPGAVAIDSDGRIAVLLSGINEVMIEGRSYRHRVRVGHRPASLISVAEELFVANQFDDSVSVIDWKTGTVSSTISLGPQTKLTARDRGERLFFDARLSHDGWMSCHSCHTDGHSAGVLADTLGDNAYGAAKRAPSLLGVSETGPWGWNGQADSLPAQVQKSIRTTMHGSALRPERLNELVVYLRSLKPPPKMKKAANTIVQKGREIFLKQGCAECHAGPLYTSDGTFDVQLVDKAGNRKFNPPSLRGFAHRVSFFHDGRFDRGADVVEVAKHKLQSELTAEEVAALLAFLDSL